MTSNDTTDDFAEAARVEAWRRHLDPVGFREGAEWARIHLAAQEPTDAEIEAEALRNAAADMGEWAEHLLLDNNAGRTQSVGDWLRDRAALSAARKA